MGREERPRPSQSPRWPWLCLVLAMFWVALVRLPLILNAEIHLDSDLAVDGLTLLDATHGHWRWHFPGTPYMGIPPILLSYPGALALGVNARSLVLGGVIAYEAVVLATFLLCWKAFGPRVAAWGLVPLAFASVGTVWLSGRVTGGHLLTLAWHVAALAMLHGLLRKGGIFRAFALGIWCGFGLYLDQMFLMTLLTVAAIVFPAMLSGRTWAIRFGLTLACLIGFAIGVVPRFLGERSDPHDAYEGQFSTIFRPETNGPLKGQVDRDRVKTLLKNHASLFVLECLPRLISGHLLTGTEFPTEPPPRSLAGGAPAKPAEPLHWLGSATIAVTIPLFFASLLALGFARTRDEPASASAVRFAMILSAGLVTGGFLISTNIFNSDNYRYLVYWLLPSAVGFGLLMDSLWRRGIGGRALALLLSLGLAGILTIDTFQWYRGFGWIDDKVQPHQRVLHDPALEYLQGHPRVTSIFGGYWDVYRLQFLLGGHVEGLPFPNYPDRYNAALRFRDGHPAILIARPDKLAGFYKRKAIDDGGTILLNDPGVVIIDWPLRP
ncbi:MAG: hypothetical protein JWN86_2853 [Planctomycetota bacterium]|nr:hypothetical protein [Planctomycetota bacterium]